MVKFEKKNYFLKRNGIGFYPNLCNLQNKRNDYNTIHDLVVTVLLHYTSFWLAKYTS